MAAFRLSRISPHFPPAFPAFPRISLNGDKVKGSRGISKEVKKKCFN
jgi:hypothetical protein